MSFLLHRRASILIPREMVIKLFIIWQDAHHNNMINFVYHGDIIGGGELDYACFILQRSCDYHVVYLVN